MYYTDHGPAHLHAEYQGNKVVLDFRGNVVRGDLGSRTALRLLRDWIDRHAAELQQNWDLARSGKEPQKIEALD